MKFGSVCSGIEAASVAWGLIGWEAAFFSEIEAFPSALLAHRFPDVPNLGDMTKFMEWPDAAIDVLVGGTPCQSFSVAGLRQGLDDPRGNLMLVYLAIARRYRPRWMVWENVPGVLSVDGGRAFGSFLGGLAELGYGFAYRVLDAQYVRVDGFARAVPQRRRRVFVVGCLGDWRRAAAVLFEPEGMSGNLAPRRGSGPGVAALTANGVGTCGADDNQAQAGHLVPSIARCVTAGYATRFDADTEDFVTVAHSLRAEGFDASEDGTGRGTPIVPVVAGTMPAAGGTAKKHGHGWGQQEFLSGYAVAVPVPFDTTQLTSAANRSNPKPGDPCHPLAAGAHPPAIAFDARQSDVVQYGPITGPLDTNGTSVGVLTARSVALRGREGGGAIEMGDDLAYAVRASQGGGDKPHVLTHAVRRLMPLECERLQGFPDDWTAVPFRGKPASDGPRYKALGNSMACNVMRWIGLRIQAVEDVSR